MRKGSQHLRQPLCFPATNVDLHGRSGTSRNATARKLSLTNYLGGISASGFSLDVNVSVTLRTEGQEILTGIIPLMASALQVVNLQVRKRATRLATPTVPLQNLLAQALVGLVSKPNPRSLGMKLDHGLHQPALRTSLSAS